MPEESVLSLESVTKVYLRSHLGRSAATRGVEDLSLQVRPGEAFGLLGLNGSGKTTTFKLALGLLRPTAGRIALFGLSPSDPAARSRVGFLPELPYFYSFLTPEESLRFYGRLSGLPEKGLQGRIREVLGALGLGAAGGRKIAELSKGMIQRVGLAQAILHDPELVILDEPVSGLDPLAIKEFRDLLLALSEKGKALVLSSHSISELEKICHRVGILKEGRLARTLAEREWREAPGGLEGLFVEAVRP